VSSAVDLNHTLSTVSSNGLGLSVESDDCTAVVPVEF
jgi:hypothetical protein